MSDNSMGATLFLAVIQTILAVIYYGGYGLATVPWWIIWLPSLIWLALLAISLIIVVVVLIIAAIALIFNRM